MGSLDSYDPDNGPVLPDVPHLTVEVLATRFLALTLDADGLALPWIVTIDEANQLLTLEFGAAEQSVSDIAAWSFRFGGVMQSHPCGMLQEDYLHVTANFEYHGATVTVFAFIPRTGEQGSPS